MKSFFILFASLIIDQAFAADLLPSMGKPGEEKTVIRYEGITATPADSPASGGKIETSRNYLSVSSPLFQSKEESFVLAAQASALHINGQPVLPTQPPTIAPNLYDLQVGGTYTHVLEGDRSWSANLNFGSASDQPYSSWDVDIVSSTFAYNKPAEGNDRWIFLVNYSNNRPILNNIPLPGFAYVYKPDPTFFATFGIPFANIFWMPSPKWNITFFTLVPWIYKAEVGYFVAGPVRIFTSVDFSQQLFLNKDRLDTQDRLFYDSKKFSVGVRSPFAAWIGGFIAGGTVFQRSFFEGKSYSDISKNRVLIGDSAFLEAGLSANF